MQFGLLITDHGKHSDEKLAIATAAEIIQIAAGASGKQAIDARKLENDIIDVLTEHHAKVSKNEVDKLDADPAGQLTTKLDPMPHMTDIVDRVLEVAKKSPFKDWFERDDVKQLIRDKVASWTATNMLIHRDWHSLGKTGHGADLKPVPGHRPDAEHIKLWRDRTDNGADSGHGSGLPPGFVESGVTQAQRS
jgi:hypothetical protein